MSAAAPTLNSFKKWLEEFMAHEPTEKPYFASIPFVAGKRYRLFGEMGWMPLRPTVPAEPGDREFTEEQAEKINKTESATVWCYTE